MGKTIQWKETRVEAREGWKGRVEEIGGMKGASGGQDIGGMEGASGGHRRGGMGV